MPIVERRIFHINDLVGNIDNAQICFEPLEDPDLGFRMFGYKTDEGDTFKCLAKDQDARMNNVRLLGSSFNGSSAYLMHNSTGVISGSHTPVTTIAKLGSTPYGGAWSFVEGTNITITQDSANRRLTINGQAGTVGYDDSSVFYHSGSRPGTGNWTLYDGSDYHGIGGLVYLRGQADNQTSAFQQVSFTVLDGIIIEDRIVGSEPDPDRESSITLNQNEAISGAAILVAKLKDADGVLTFGADQSGVYWHDRILRESTDWGAGNPFLLADSVEDTNPYDDLYAALGDQRLPLVNILALLAANGGAKLEENAVGYGSSDGLLSGNATNLAWDESVFQLKVGPGPSPTHLGEASGIMLTGHLECTGNEYLYGHLVLGANNAESKIQCLTGSIQFEDAYCDWTTKPRLSNSLAQYTAVKADFGGAEDSIFGYLHRLFNAVPGTATLQTAYDAGDTITIGANGPVEILADTATSGRGKCLVLRGTHADRIEPVVDIKNDSTSNGPSIYFQGNAGANDYGHELLTETRLSLHSAFAVDSTTFDGFVSVYRDEAGYDISGVMIKAMCSDASKPAYINLQCQYSDPGRDTSSVEIYCDSFFMTSSSLSINGTGGDATIQSPGDLDISGSGDVLLSAGGEGHFIDLGTNRVKNAVSVSHGLAPTSIAYGSTIAANFETGNAFQSCTATGNITTVTLTPPVGVQACQLMVFASGGARSITGFSGSVSWGEPIDPDVVGYTISSGEWVIFWLYWNGLAWFGTAIPKFS